MQNRKEIYDALVLKYKAQQQKAKTNLKVYFLGVVGVAEHPDLMETIEKEVGVMAEYDDKLAVLDKYFSKDFGEGKTLLNE